MCGIVGLLLRKEGLRSSLGELMLPMFQCMAERGPDSAGLAVFGQAVAAPLRRYDLFAFDHATDWMAWQLAFERETGVKGSLRAVDNHAVLTAAIAPDALAPWLAKREREL